MRNELLAISTDRDLFYFKFMDYEDRQKVLDGGPIFIAGRIFIIRPWSKDLQYQREHLKLVPIWVKLYDVPKVLWTKKAFSMIGTKLGKPHCWDVATQRGT
ncbi:hypothetical protein IFM89_031333 [Coptis chinensis]|uniref:DUF4283 domain-containing protein n=1 Tax=Coptis chinensis TaxID=261450 RepID=A0A835IY26_9MAGN|nr:hypothetical protein IFM89_031333 [Coptis chinensis]